LRSQEPTPPTGFPIILRNLYEGKTQGVEVAANYEPYRFWLLHTAYTLQKIDLKPAAGSRDTTGAVAESEDPEHVFALRSYLDLPGEIELDFLFRAIGELAGGRTPAYQELDMRLGWQPSPRVTLSLIGRDLLHARHTELRGGAGQPRFFQREALGRITWAF
jgi:iron complex outermembrane receptor protein